MALADSQYMAMSQAQLLQYCLAGEKQSNQNAISVGGGTRLGQEWIAAATAYDSAAFGSGTTPKSVINWMDVRAADQLADVAHADTVAAQQQAPQQIPFVPPATKRAAAAVAQGSDGGGTGILVLIAIGAYLLLRK